MTLLHLNIVIEMHLIDMIFFPRFLFSIFLGHVLLSELLTFSLTPIPPSPVFISLSLHNHL